MKNIIKNFFYQTIFQITRIIIPIITVPIISNALGPGGVGLYNYTFSVAQYFVLLAGLGITLYGNREIALAWTKKKDFSQTFCEIFTFKALCSISFLVIYFLLVMFFFDHKIYYFAQSLTIIAVFFDISWFFMGIEDFKKTSLSNLVVQVLTFVLIIIFIKDKNDTLLYTLIQTVSMLMSQLAVWPFIKKYITFKPVSVMKSLRHFKGSVTYFIPQVAILLYTNLNKTLLGLLVGSTAVGYYTNSMQLNDVFVTIITTLDVVLLPHMSSLFAKDKTNRIVEVMDATIHIQLFFSIPLMFGMLTVYDKLVPWFFGNKFLFIEQVIPFLTILLVIKPLGISIARQYLMPIGRVGQYNVSVIIGAVINIIGNMILLPFLGFWGVIISVLLAEFFVTFVRTFAFIRKTEFKFNLKQISIYFLAGIVMCLLTRYLTREMNASIITNILQALIAVVIYMGITVVMKANPIFEVIKGRYSK